MIEAERRLGAVLLSAIVIVSVAGAGPVSSAAAGSASGAGSVAVTPAVDIQNQSIDDSTDATISLSYDASGAIDAGDVMVQVSGPNLSVSRTPNSESGTLDVAVPAGTWEGGEQAVTATLMNASNSAVEAADYGIVAVDDTSTIANYTVSDEDATTYTQENVTVSVNVTNTGSSEDNVTVGAYRPLDYVGEQRDLLTDLDDVEAYRKVSLAAGATEQVELNVSFENAGSHTVVVNDESPTSVPVTSRVAYADHEFANESSGETVTDDVLQTNETYYLNVTYENPTSKEDSRHVSYCPPEGCQGGRITVAAQDTETVSYEVNYSEPGTKYLWATGAGSFNAYVVKDTTGTPNLTVDERQPPAIAVDGKDAYFSAEVTNHGDAGGTKTVNLSVGGSKVDSSTVVLEPGETRHVFLTHSFTGTGQKTATFADEQVDVTVQKPVVQGVTVEHVGGTEPGTMPQVSGQLSSFGMISVDVRNTNGGSDLSAVGADDTTRFRLNVTLTDYEPRVLVTSGKNTNWTVEDGPGNEKYLVVNTTAAQLDYMNDAPRIENWNDVAEDRADLTLDSALMVGVTDGTRTDVFETDPTELTGMTISTDAQVFRPPAYFPGNATHEPSLQIRLAGPHETANGNVNQGYYEAFLPNGLLQEWNVDSESDLAAAYSGSQNTQLSVTKKQGGWEARLDIHYSSGTVEISRKQEQSGDGGTPTTTVSPSLDVPSTATPTPTPTPTPTVAPTPNPTTTSSATATATADRQSTSASTPESATATATSTANEGSTTVGATARTESGGQPGFGVGSAVLALVAALAVATRRR